ncbi:4-hydroxyphenylacetate 3-hydroxylase N-terminal domain-containing protein, partial [Priestia megaterium]|uniref:4-hydroxyphenylacetate 3-hydroxylase N-terminal domain-containing protein n=1 Tax=Priestia megaterium TaxID=1404 RepID=UPI0037094B40
MKTISAINHNQYLHTINQLKPNLSLHPKLLTPNISQHPPFKPPINSQPKLYHLHHHKKIKHIITYQYHDSNHFFPTSYLHPTTKQQLKNSPHITHHSPPLTHPMMGRTPDYMNTL